MVIYRGEIWWADLPQPVGSEPGYRRPVLIIQEDMFTNSNIQTVIVAIITSNLALEAAPGNVLLPKKYTGLLKDSVVNVSQVITIDKNFLSERIGSLNDDLQSQVDDGLRTILYL
jgi:mRNA interferase MazF